MKLRRRIQLAATHVCSFDGFLDTACVDVTTVDGLNQARRLIDGSAAVGSAAAALIITAPAR